MLEAEAGLRKFRKQVGAVTGRLGGLSYRRTNELKYFFECCIEQQGCSRVRHLRQVFLT